MDRFSKYNPKAVLLFFISEITATLLIFNPIYLCISFLSAFVYKLIIDGKKAVLYLIKFIIPLVVLISVFNMLFVHTGVTEIFTLFDMSFTLESLFYGFCQGIMFAAVIIWMSNYSKAVTSEGLLAVFGRKAPNISLVFSMILTFIPRLKRNLDEINDASALLDNGEGKIKKGISNLSALISMTLEESIETADSMKARGFNNNRTPYSKYPFSFKDFVLIAIELIFLGALIFFKASGKTIFIFEPRIYVEGVNIVSVIIFSSLSFIPVMIDLGEELRWLYLKQKI
ncbi:MAG: energy-coupling factor transporter transmembrane protein EcfT [Acetobacter sp.]|nr:energy-coupling factor transporter transmembrane protein EcfT [Bacteroides sp.]MCM1341497.1 energy-coupling factor transporter transmembrane protein EcfT [Acetobacter sp.]MCM1433715.1 energy-coupling factor transporter transmembrane protein EcfT [Clostridiales bacterium]